MAVRNSSSTAPVWLENGKFFICWDTDYDSENEDYITNLYEFRNGQEEYVGLKVNETERPYKVFHKYYYDMEDADDGIEYHIRRGNNRAMERKSHEEIKNTKEATRQEQLGRKNDHERQVRERSKRREVDPQKIYDRWERKRVFIPFRGSVIDPNEYMKESDYQKYRRFEEEYKEEFVTYIAYRDMEDDGWD